MRNQRYSCLNKEKIILNSQERVMMEDRKKIIYMNERHKNEENETSDMSSYISRNRHDIQVYFL